MATTPSMSDARKRNRSAIPDLVRTVTRSFPSTPLRTGNVHLVRRWLPCDAGDSQVDGRGAPPRGMPDHPVRVAPGGRRARALGRHPYRLIGIPSGWSLSAPSAEKRPARRPRSRTGPLLASLRAARSAGLPRIAPAGRITSMRRGPFAEGRPGRAHSGRLVQDEPVQDEPIQDEPIQDKRCGALVLRGRHKQLVAHRPRETLAHRPVTRIERCCSGASP